MTPKLLAYYCIAWMFECQPLLKTVHVTACKSVGKSTLGEDLACHFL